jgi:membrane-associated phospholipid phosphatase
VLIDAPARHGLVASTRDGRDRADELSDFASLTPLVVLWGETLFLPLVLDDFNWDVAWHVTVINLQSSALNGLLTRAGNRIGVRARPDVAECAEDPEYSQGCFRGETASFPSGHTSTAFLAAGLSCAHHLQLGLYANETADTVMCVVLGATAAATGTLRIMADRHHLSDVLTGATVGFGSGFALPMLVHYAGGSDPAGHGTPRTASAVRWTVAPLATERTAGLALYGWF